MPMGRQAHSPLPHLAHPRVRVLAQPQTDSSNGGGRRSPPRNGSQTSHSAALQPHFHIRRGLSLPTMAVLCPAISHKAKAEASSLGGEGVRQSYWPGLISLGGGALVLVLLHPQPPVPLGLRSRGPWEEMPLTEGALNWKEGV